MREWLIHYGSYGLAPFGLLGMYVVGLKKRWGWVLSMTTQVLWALYAVGTFQFGFLIGTVSYFLVYLKNWRGWAPAGDPVVELLRDLNRLELEKDRDGSAEQPWWYMRDAVAQALGVTFTDELSEEAES